MLEELRLSPRSPAALFRGCCPGERAATDPGGVSLSFSTGFADRPRRQSTGVGRTIHSAARHQEVAV